jgi:hypothetical protein
MKPLGPAQVRRQRRTLIALALLFLAPLALAFYLYYGLNWHPGGRVNHGELIDPPRPLPALELTRVALAGGGGEAATAADFLKRKWTFLYWGAGSCAERCRTDLYNTRQVRLALHRDMDRVQRVFVADGDRCDLDFLRSQHPDLITVKAGAQAAPLLALLRQADGIDPATADRVYLIDPLGNLMMWYAPDARPRGMLDDIKRLLGLSHVG